MEANSGKGWTETDATSVREFWDPRIRFRYERLKGVVGCMAAEFSFHHSASKIISFKNNRCSRIIIHLEHRK